MKKFLFSILLTLVVCLPLSVNAAVSFDAYDATSNPQVPADDTLGAAITAAGVGGIVVIKGDTADKYQISNDISNSIFVVADTLEVEVLANMNVIGAATINNGKITVTGAGSASLPGLTNYICPVSTCNFNTIQAGSKVTIKTIDIDGATYPNLALLLANTDNMYSEFDIVGKVTLGQNLGIMSHDVLNITANAELVVPSGIHLDTRNQLNIAATGKLTIEGTLYNSDGLTNNGTIDVNGTLINGAMHTAGAVNREQEGGLVVGDTGTINVVGTLENSNATAETDIQGTMTIGEDATITNPQYITSDPNATITNNTATDITIKTTDGGGGTIDRVLTATPIEENPQTSDSIITFILLTIISFTLLVTVSYNLKKRYN